MTSSFAEPSIAAAVAPVDTTGTPAAAAAGDRRRTLLIVIAAALPTLVSALRGGFLADDWIFLRAAETSGNTWWLHGLDRWFRPVQALLHGVMFETFRGHPSAALVTVAALEVIAVLALRTLARRFLPHRAADVVAFVWAVLPNRAAPRLWLSAAPVTVCVILLLCAGLAATATKRRPILATLLCCTAVLTYEAGVLVGLLIVVWAWYDADLDRRDLLVRIGWPTLVYGVVVAWNVATSPKTPSAAAASRSALDALVGAGLSPAALGGWGTLTGAVVVIAAVVSARRSVSWRTAEVGALLALAGLLPLLAVGASPSVNGPVDRLNVIPMLGVALLIGIGLDALVDALPRPVLTVGAVALLAMAGLAHADDISSVNAARRDAERAVTAFDHLPARLADARLVLDPGAGHHGWFAFGWDSARAAVDRDLRDPPAGHLDPEPDEHVVRVEGTTVVEVDAVEVDAVEVDGR